MSGIAQIELLSAQKVAQDTPVQQAPNGICYASFGDTHLPQSDLERVIQSVPRNIAAALERRAYYFVPLTLGETDETMVAPGYTVDLGDRAICHRNVKFGSSECIFISTRLMQDRFALAFEFFINVGHHFVESVGVPESFSDLAWSQAEADVRGETSQDAYENRRRAIDRATDRAGDRGIERIADRSSDRNSDRRNDLRRANSIESLTADDGAGTANAAVPAVDERARSAYFEAAFSDAIAIYMLSLTLDFDYSELREREYPLLAAPALAERLRHIAKLFPPNPGYEFQISYRRRN